MYYTRMLMVAGFAVALSVTSALAGNSHNQRGGNHDSQQKHEKHHGKHDHHKPKPGDCDCIPFEPGDNGSDGCANPGPGE